MSCQNEVERRGMFYLPALAFLVGVSACTARPDDAERPSRGDLPGITLHIRNGQAVSPLNLVAGQDYVFDRIILEAENNDVTDSLEALRWLSRQSDFRALNWEGVRETQAYWRNYKATSPEADIFAHVFEGAAWMGQPNNVQVSVLGGRDAILGTPLRLSHQDFLNSQKQWDYDMIRAEFRYEGLARHKDKSSARIKRAVAKVVFAVQTNRSKRLRVPAGATAVQLIWDQGAGQTYFIPVHLLPAPLPYGLQVQADIRPVKAVYQPGDTVQATFRLLDGNGNVLRLADFATNGVVRLHPRVEGPRHDPTVYHEEWLNRFPDGRFAHIVRFSPTVGSIQEGRTVTTPLKQPPFDPTGTALIVEFHIPEGLPRQAYGTFELRAAAARRYGSQLIELDFVASIQVGQAERTEMEKFRCASCHLPDTPMDVAVLIPPMWGTKPLDIENLQECILCHANTRSGAHRLGKYLHLIHTHRDKFPVAKNNCVVCHIATAGIKKVAIEACSSCHEAFHENNRPRYTEEQCQGCHTDSRRGHIVATE